MKLDQAISCAVVDKSTGVPCLFQGLFPCLAI